MHIKEIIQHLLTFSKAVDKLEEWVSTEPGARVASRRRRFVWTGDCVSTADVVRR